jgi:RNA polymerase sigma factor (sigma-70 family)
MYASTEQHSRERVQVLADQLYRDHHGRLFAIARKNAANSSDAEEAVQFGFLAFIEHFDPDDEAPPLAWLTLVTKRECWARYNRRRLDRSANREVAAGALINSIPSRATGPEQLVAQVDEARAKLATLKPQELHALSLLAAGYTYKEIVAMNRWTYTKVNRCIAEGRARLRANAATEQPQMHHPGDETPRADALASRPAKKEEAVDSSDLDRLIGSEVAR